MIHTIIIGENSNLSNILYKKIPNCSLISSRKLVQNINELGSFNNRRVNIIFNNFQPAVKLNILENTSEYISSAIVVTAKVLDYFDNSNINKIIYTSSASVYGNNILCKESDELKPMNLHASLKVSNEKLIAKYCLDNNIDYSITRIFNMYGGNDNFSIIRKIINASLNNEKITIVNNGNAIRDFIHIDDVAEVYLNLLKLKNVRILNIGTGEGNSIKNIVDFLINKNITIDLNNIYRNELKISTADNQLLMNLTNKNDFIKVEDYLRKELNL